MHSPVGWVHEWGITSYRIRVNAKLFYSWPFTNHLMTILSAVITIGITVTFIFHIFPPLWQGPGNIIVTCWEFYRMVFHWSLRKRKSPQISRTLLSFQANLNNTGVWMVSTSRLILKTSSLCINPLVALPTAPITIGIIISSCSIVFFIFLSKVKVLIFLFTFFKFHSVVSRDGKFSILPVLFFCWVL